MMKVGLTGGIGSGKTTIAKMFEELGVPVYYADDEAKKLMNSNPQIQKELLQLLGENAYKSRELNRAFIAGAIFNDKNKLKKINAIVHPVVANHFEKWAHHQQSKYVIQENAIIFESGTQDKFDKIITVTAPVEIKIDRVMNRDHMSKEKVKERMNNQLKDDYKIENSFYVIHNLDLEKSLNEVKKIHKSLMGR